MPNLFAQAAGNVNAANIWWDAPTGGSNVPFASITASDVLYANNRAITLNVNVTVAQIRNDVNGTGATAGGGFTLNDGVTLTAAVVGGNASAFLVTVALNATCSIVGSITGAGASFAAVTMSNSGASLTVTGSVTGGTSSSAGIAVGSTACNLTVNGTVNGSAITGSFGAIHLTGNSTVVVNGDVTGGSVSTAGFGVFAQAGTMTVNGTVTGGSQGPGASFTTNATANIRRAKGNGFGPGSSGLSSAVGVASTQTPTVTISEIEYGARGQSPTSGPVFLNDVSTNVAVFVRTNLTTKTLVDNAAAADFPANSNVRSGVVFANGNRTGTCAVPAASSVASGVSVDATVGTAVLTSAAAQSACAAALTAFASGRLADVATVASTGQQIADAGV